jgi:hypothetical protein
MGTWWIEKWNCVNGTTVPSQFATQFYGMIYLMIYVLKQKSLLLIPSWKHIYLQSFKGLRVVIDLYEQSCDRGLLLYCFDWILSHFWLAFLEFCVVLNICLASPCVLMVLFVKRGDRDCIPTMSEWMVSFVYTVGYKVRIGIINCQSWPLVCKVFQWHFSNIPHYHLFDSVFFNYLYLYTQLVWIGLVSMANWCAVGCVEFQVSQCKRSELLCWE